MQKCYNSTRADKHQTGVTSEAARIPISGGNYEYQAELMVFNFTGSGQILSKLLLQGTDIITCDLLNDANG